MGWGTSTPALVEQSGTGRLVLVIGSRMLAVANLVQVKTIYVKICDFNKIKQSTKAQSTIYKSIISFEYFMAAEIFVFRVKCLHWQKKVCTDIFSIRFCMYVGQILLLKHNTPYYPL